MKTQQLAAEQEKMLAEQREANNKEQETAIKLADRLNESAKTNNQIISEQVALLMKHKQAILDSGVSQKELDNIFEEFEQKRLDNNTDFASGWKRAMESYGEDAENAAKHAEEIFADTANAMEDTIKSFVKTGKFEFRELTQAIVDSLLDAQIQQLTNSIFSSFNTGGAGSSNVIGNFFAGFFANGGLIPAGQFGVVGEAGPELVSGPAQVTPLDGSSGSVTYNINAVDAESFKQLVARDPAFLYAVTEQGRRTLPSGR
jgi:phage-related minor tail protein